MDSAVYSKERGVKMNIYAKVYSKVVKQEEKRVLKSTDTFFVLIILLGGLYLFTSTYIVNTSYGDIVNKYFSLFVTLLLGYGAVRKLELFKKEYVYERELLIESDELESIKDTVITSEKLNLKDIEDILYERGILKDSNATLSSTVERDKVCIEIELKED